MCFKNLPPRAPFALLTFSMAAILTTAFIMEYAFHIYPCQMCWWQRVGEITLAVFALAGTAKPHQSLWLAISACAGATLSVALWQVAAQHNWLPFPPGCHGNPNAAMADPTNLLATLSTTHVIPCDKETFKLLGQSLAVWNSLLMFATIAWAGCFYGSKKGR